MTNISTCCIDVDTNLRIPVSIYNGTGRFLRISGFSIPNSELRVPISDVRISERLDSQMFGLWFLDFRISRFLDFLGSCFSRFYGKCRNLEN